MSLTRIGSEQVVVGDQTVAELAQSVGFGIYNYGPLAADPTLRPDGSAMVSGDEYHNTVTGKRRQFDGVVWNDFIGASTADLANATDPAKGAGMVGYNGHSLAKKLLETRSVIDFGAVPNDATKKVVNLTAFRNAMTEFKAKGGGELFIPPGVYYLSSASSIYVPSNVTLRGIRGASVLDIDVSDLPSGAYTSVILTGDPDTNTRAGVTGTQIHPSVGTVDPASVVYNVHYRDLTLVCNYAGAALSSRELRGLSLYFAWDSSVTGCQVYGMPNTGILTLGGGRSSICDNISRECGWTGANPSTRNGFSVNGWMDHTNPALTSSSIVVSGNHALDNYDEGIMYAMVNGIVISGNTLIGNRDRGIEGDSGLANTITAATYGQQIPGDTIITGNYVDGAGSHQSESDWGITATDSNERRIHVTNNVIRNVGGSKGSAILISQAAGGIIVVSGNTLENIKPTTNNHPISVQAARVEVRDNRILSLSGATTDQAGIRALFTNTCVIEGNTIEAGIERAIVVQCGWAVANYTPGLISIRNNIALGCAADGIFVRLPYATTLPLLDISSNMLAGVNSRAASDKNGIRIDGSSSYTLTIADAFINANRITYTGATLYPIGGVNVAAGAITRMHVAENFFGDPTMPYGKSPLASQNVATYLYQSNNRLPGNHVIYGSAAPTTGAWAIGDRVIRTAPVPGQNEGWICTAAGTPGTWKAFGTVAA